MPRGVGLQGFSILLAGSGRGDLLYLSFVFPNALSLSLSHTHTHTHTLFQTSFTVGRRRLVLAAPVRLCKNKTFITVHTTAHTHTHTRATACKTVYTLSPPRLPHKPPAPAWCLSLFCLIALYFFSLRVCVHCARSGEGFIFILMLHTFKNTHTHTHTLEVLVRDSNVHLIC